MHPHVLAETAAVAVGAVVVAVFGQVPSWIGDGTAIAGLILAIGGVCALVARLAKWMVAKFTVEVRDVVKAEAEPLHHAIHELRTHVVAVSKIVGYELAPNGGNSVKDRVERLDQALAGQED